MTDRQKDRPSLVDIRSGIEADNNSDEPATTQWRALLDLQNANMMELIKALHNPRANASSSPELPEFNPDKPDADARSWCTTADLCVADTPLQGSQLVRVVSKAMKGTASTWLAQVTYADITWEEFRELFIARFACQETNAGMMINFLNDRPKENVTLVAYASRLITTLTNRWKEATKEQIAVSTVLSHIAQFDTRIQRLAFTTEINSRQQLQKELQAFSFKRKLPLGNDTNVGHDLKRSKYLQPNLKCFKCGRAGHKITECHFKGRDQQRRRPQPAGVGNASQTTQNYPTKAKIICFKCGVAGHVANRCPAGSGASSEFSGASSGFSGASSSNNGVAERRVDLCVVKPPTGTLEHQGSPRRTTTPSSTNATRDSQLLSLLAARRRQLLNGRLATHINTLASLAHKANKTNTTFAQLEIKDLNSSTVKKIRFDNTSSESTPTLKLITSDGIKEIHQEVKPHEIRHLFIPKLLPDTRSRAGFVNNRKSNKTVTIPDLGTEPTIVYVPPEKLEGLDKEIELDPDEEFQVDESNHGLYLLNYSDPENVTQAPDVNVTITANIGNKENITLIVAATTASNISKEITTPKPEEEDKPETNIIANSTDTNTKPESEKQKDNTTLFMSQEIYNHFRPLETELPVDEMAPFIYFGQKLSGQAINDNLTHLPSLSASTKSVNFIAAPSEKRKFNSRYSATEKYKNTSADEEEINEDMDVSVVKNIIEKNKVRNTVKGPAPARHVGLVNAYRKYPSTTPGTTKSLNIAQFNITEPIVTSIISDSTDKSKESNRTNSTNLNRDIPKTAVSNSTKEVSNRTVSTTVPRNFTRNYSNLRRKPARVAASTTDNAVHTVAVNTTTTEKASTVYTAVVTSVSITSSMKGQNKTDMNFKDIEENATVVTIPEVKNETVAKTVVNETETTTLLPLSSTTVSSTSSPRIFRHRIRIRTTTTESSLDDSPVIGALSSEQSTKPTKTRNETVSKISFRQNENNSNVANVTTKPKSILRRRRPTTTTSTSTTTPIPTLVPTAPMTTPALLPVSHFTTAPSIETTEATFKPFVVTSRTSTKSSSKPLSVSHNMTESKVNVTVDKGGPASNEEVVIEAEKTYTASYVLAGLGFLPVAAIIIFVLRSIMNKKTKELETEYEGYFDDGADIKKESPITPVARAPLPTPSKPDQKWEFPRNKLRLQTLLGQGNFGQVWKAEADDLNGHDGLTRLVAVKSIKETASQKEKQELLHEIYIMQKIGTHPNVVTLLACCTEQEPYLLIMEYVMCGKLLTYLRERRSRPDRFSGSGALTSRDLTVFAYCVARGMDYIASKGIVHRDLAARNVLVDHNKLCKIADFGMSRCAGAAARAPRGALPVRWMAPEALLYNVYSHHSDVWAFGILLWEIVTLGSTPYAAMSGREVLTAVTEGYRLERPPHCKPQLYRAMHTCWHADPSQRPSFATLKGQLAELLDNEPVEGNYVDLDSFYQESSVYSDPSAIIHDEDGLSAEYDRERRVFRELATGTSKFDNRAFSLRDEELRNKFGIGTPRMGGFGIRDVPFNDRNFSDGEFNERNFTDKNFNDTNFTERKDGKLSTSSFHRERERERENPIVSRNSFNGFPRIGTRENHFQMSPDGRNKRVSEFECDI